MAVYDEGEGKEEKKCSTPTKSNILNNFACVRVSRGHCPGALPAFFGGYVDTPVFALYVTNLLEDRACAKKVTGGGQNPYLPPPGYMCIFFFFQVGSKIA